MRVGVIGAGAIGGVIAARLLRAGVDVAVAAGRHAELRALQVRGEPEVAVAKIGATLPDGRYDLLLLCTRTQDTEAALRPAVPLLAGDGAVVCVQNGLPEARAAALAGAERVLGAVVGWSASQVGAGEYVVTGGGKFTLGGAGARLDDAAKVLARVFPVRVTRNLQGARWSKLAMNCAMSTLGAVSGLSLGELAASRATRALALAVVREVVEAGRAAGVRFERVAGLRPDALVSWPRPLQHAAVWLAARRRPAQRSGMIARLREGRSAGAEDLNALVPGPLNAHLTAMVHEIERGARSIAPANLRELGSPP